MFQFCKKKLKALNPIFRTLNKVKYGNIHHRIEEQRAKLLQIQQCKFQSFTEALAQAERDQAKVLSELLLAEEYFLRQRSKDKVAKRW